MVNYNVKIENLKDLLLLEDFCTSNNIFFEKEKTKTTELTDDYKRAHEAVSELNYELQKAQKHFKMLESVLKTLESSKEYAKLKIEILVKEVAPKI